MVRALAALAALALAWAELLRDDECLDGSCALSALQLKAKPEVDLDILCSKADSVCSALGDDGGPSLTDLRQLLAVANSTFQAFSDAIDLHNLVENELVPCKALCVASAKLLVRQSITLPRQPDVGCFRNAAGVDVCNVDLSPAKLRKRFGSGKKRFAKLQDAAGALPSRIKKWQHRNWEDPLQHAFESQVQSYSAELALRILYMFHVYPRAFNTFQAAEVAQPEDWHDKLAHFNLIARVFVVNSIRNLRMHETQPYLKLWFGDAAIGNELEATRREVLRVLNSALHVMNTAMFLYNSTMCTEDTFAFVFPAGNDGVPDLKDNFRKNQKGQYVVYVCPLTVKAESMGLLPDAVQTMAHEASHHEYAYLDDVYTCSRSQYIWLEADHLADMKGSACFGSEIPRFSVSGTSCDVPGKELLSRANWTRPLYARGNKNATSCPVNMADITTAEECRAAADLLGVTFMEDEVDDDWPTGCYEIVAGPFEGAYFNSAKPGMPVEGVPSLCRTLPAAAPATDGRCSEHYNLRNGGCELKLPFQILASGSQCPQEEKVRFPHACMQAADILGVMYGGHSNSMHHPYGCYQDFETKELHFNSENGAVNKDAGVVCQQRFSFSVVDPRLTYTLSTLRFSQDGNAVLFSMDSEALGQECDMAYGRQWCKLLAKHEPDKALLNADSFGYYVLDAGMPDI